MRKGNLALQVQTEYAVRPNPRITTTILKEGQVLHKIERVLDHEIASFEEQRSIEVGMKRQHIEVVDILQSASPEAALNLTSNFTPEGKSDKPLSITERLSQIPGVRKLYHLDYDGNFEGSETTEQFKKQFSFVFKNLRDVLTLFSELPGGGHEQGVYEVEQDRLYFVSLGQECYFLLVSPVHSVSNYEAAIKEVLNSAKK